MGIGTKNPDTTSVLDLSSTTKGALFPRMTTAQRTDITAPAIGLTVFDLDSKTYWYYADSAWVEISTNKDESSQDNNKSRDVSDFWTTQGNDLSGTEFIGTTSESSLEFRANDVRSGFIDLPLNNTFFGYAAGSQSEGEFNVAIGKDALHHATGAVANIAIGVAALYNNLSGQGNVIMGPEAAYYNQGSENVVIGHGAFYRSGNQSSITAIGTRSMMNILGPEDGSPLSSTAVGYEAMLGSDNYGNNTGNLNTAVGHQALRNISSGKWKYRPGSKCHVFKFHRYK